MDTYKQFHLIGLEASTKIAARMVIDQPSRYQYNYTFWWYRPLASDWFQHYWTHPRL